jgi:isopenicillin N synthase-like dioxygenase
MHNYHTHSKYKFCKATAYAIVVVKMRASLRGAATAVRGLATSAVHAPPVELAAPSAAAGAAMLDRAATTGFFSIRCAEVSQELMDTAFEQSHSLFSTPLATRKELAWRNPISNRGAYSVRTPSVGGDGELDNVGVFVMGREVAAPELLRAAWLERSQHPSLVSLSQDELLRAAAAPNPWPSEAQLPVAAGPRGAGAARFRAVFEEYHAACTRAGEAVLASLALALELAPERLLDLHGARDHTVELKCFPTLPVPAPGSRLAEYVAALEKAEAAEESEFAELLLSSKTALVRRVGAHTDFCSLTLLALPRDDVGGLQEYGADGRYHHVRHADGVLLVHVGDMLETLLGAHVRGTRHRVVTPTSARAWRANRYTMQFFMSPNREAPIAPLLPLASGAQAHDGTAPLLPLLLRGERPHGGALCGDLVLERHDAILAPRMELYT